MCHPSEHRGQILASNGIPNHQDIVDTFFEIRRRFHDVLMVSILEILQCTDGRQLCSTQSNDENNTCQQNQPHADN
jgi:hypothetical protein